MDEREGLQGAALVDGGGGRATVRLARLLDLPFRRLEVALEEPPLEQRGAVPALRDLELAVAQAGLGRGDGAFEGGGGIGSDFGGGRGERAAEQQARDPGKTMRPD